jgi:hypothetical protein
MLTHGIAGIAKPTHQKAMIVCSFSLNCKASASGNENSLGIIGPIEIHREKTLLPMSKNAGGLP